MLSYRCRVIPVLAVSLWIALLIAPNIVVVTSQPITPPIRRPVRTNTQCVSATIIPSRAITTVNPYVHNTTVFSRNSKPYEFDVAPPNVTCPFMSDSDYKPNQTKVRSAWYQWKPKISGFYDFNATILYFPYFWFSIMQGPSCSNLEKPIGCHLKSPHGVYLQANTNYYITMFTGNNYGSDLDLIISPTLHRPNNDDCQNATLIPSSVKLPYKTVSTTNIFTNATIQYNERIPSCDQFVVYDGIFDKVPTNYGHPVYKNNFGGHSVWYMYSPPTTGYYHFHTSGTMSNKYQSYPIEAPITVAVYEVVGNITNRTSDGICSDMTTQFTEVFCSRRPGLFYRTSNVDRINELKAGKQYYIQLLPDMFNHEVITNLTFTVSRISAPVANDMCTNATVIDPIVGLQNALINPNYATTDALYHPNRIECDSSGYPDNLLQHGVWYKYIHPGGIVNIVHSLYQRYRMAQYLLFQGDSCDRLRCVDFRYGSFSGGSIVTYVIDEPSTYWFFLYPNGVANFTVSIQRPNHFRLFNAENDTVVGLLPPNQWYSYDKYNPPSYVLPTTQLNINAYFQPELNVQSTRITYTNPNMSLCENASPFSAFGDTNGNYRAGKITIGAHTISAIPYTQPKCQGPAIVGAAINTTFTIRGCSLQRLLFSTGAYFTTLPYADDGMGGIMGTNVPCKTFFEGNYGCSFNATNVTVELQNTMTNASVPVDTATRREYKYDYYYFGKLNTSSPFGVSAMILSPKTTYKVAVSFNDIRHELISFSTTNTCSP